MNIILKLYVWFLIKIKRKEEFFSTLKDIHKLIDSKDYKKADEVYEKLKKIYHFLSKKKKKRYYPIFKEIYDKLLWRDVSVINDEYRVNIETAKEVAREELNHRANRGAYLTKTKMDKFIEKRRKYHLENIDWVKINFQAQCVAKKYTSIISFVNWLAKEESSQKINRGIHMPNPRLDRFIENRKKYHTSNIIKKFGDFGDNEDYLEKYKKILEEAKEMADKELRAKPNMGKDLSEQEIDKFIEKQTKTHFEELYKKI